MCTPTGGRGDAGGARRGAPLLSPCGARGRPPAGPRGVRNRRSRLRPGPGPPPQLPRRSGARPGHRLTGRPSKSDAGCALQLKRQLLEHGGCPLHRMQALRKTGWDVGVMTHNACMAGLCREGRLADAERLLHRMKDKNTSSPPPNLATYQPLLTGYGKQGDSARCEELLAEVVAGGMRPNVRCYTGVLQCLAHGGGDFLVLLRNMRDRGMRIDEPTVNAAMQQSKDFAMCEEALRLYEEREGTVSRRTLAALLSVARRASDVAAAEDVLRMMQERDHRPAVEEWTTLLCVHKQRGDLRGAEAVYERMRNWGIAPDAYVYAALVKTCVTLLEQLKPPEQHEEERRWALERAEHWHDVAEDAGWVPKSAHVSCHLMWCYAETGRSSRARDLYWRLHSELGIKRLSRPFLDAYQAAVAPLSADELAEPVKPRLRKGEVLV
eukprot:TRINITY_DN39161_c0_g1_i2.p1 TRINITY_DN39161_c0_g1~~TRINITY_DN39161_c0_g1_i2.p1  ORF type:complete len:438 (+),score=116.96 TRINITY_DN39161_c0_g1_i2:69-1382(+)